MTRKQRRAEQAKKRAKRQRQKERFDAFAEQSYPWLRRLTRGWRWTQD